MVASMKQPAKNTEDQSGRHPHTVHIPVMGTGFTVDTPLKVARYGIDSVMSIGDDILLEQMSKLHSEKNAVPFTAIEDREDNYRSRRITRYLNLVDRLVDEQFQHLKATPFLPGSEITRYFRLLPNSQLKRDYEHMIGLSDGREKEHLQEELRNRISQGSIDVNIMTKVDGDRYKNGEKLPPEEAVAMSALRGYAQSKLSSSIVLSAGMNPRLFTYMSEFQDFFPDENGRFKKKIVLKVSGYRSAMVQGCLLAKKGLWVSEFRIESGLNCGGHAFVGKGNLAGPILHEFQHNLPELKNKLFGLWKRAMEGRGKTVSDAPFPISVTYQGGIGTYEEDKFLREFYDLSGTGWGTPFLLVSEVTNVDDDHMRRLIDADRLDVSLSDHSPLGVPFWSLQTSASEDNRKRLIDAGRPGSSCPKGYLVSDTEFTKVPICKASRVYQHKSLKKFKAGESTGEYLNRVLDSVFNKSCLCRDLAAGVLQKNDIADPEAFTAVCCGPNIINFNKTATLEEMMDHIYGRDSLVVPADRPHVFIAELLIFIEYLRSEYNKYVDGMIERTESYFNELSQNILSGIEYYRSIASQIHQQKKEKFLNELETASNSLMEFLNRQTIQVRA